VRWSGSVLIRMLLPTLIISDFSAGQDDLCDFLPSFPVDNVLLKLFLRNVNLRHVALKEICGGGEVIYIDHNLVIRLKPIMLCFIVYLLISSKL
jgi:hypothetical protein